MPDSPVGVSDAASRFFENVLICLAKASIPDKHRRWYVRRVEEFIKAHNGRKIKGLSGPDISRYLQVIGGENGLADCQFPYRSDAVRILYCEPEWTIDRARNRAASTNPDQRILQGATTALLVE